MRRRGRPASRQNYPSSRSPAPARTVRNNNNAAFKPRHEDQCPPKRYHPPSGRALGPGAIALVLMLCLSWGFNQIAVKLALPDVPPMMQALIRSAGALPVMLIAGWLRG